MNSGVVEDLDLPAMKLCLYSDFVNLWIQYIQGKSSFVSLASFPKEVSTDL